jgi:hypothetical protein
VERFRDEVESTAAMVPRPSTMLIGKEATKQNFESLPLATIGYCRESVSAWIGRQRCAVSINRDCLNSVAFQSPSSKYPGDQSASSNCMGKRKYFGELSVCTPF